MIHFLRNFIKIIIKCVCHDTLEVALVEIVILFNFEHMLAKSTNFNKFYTLKFGYESLK